MAAMLTECMMTYTGRPVYVIKKDVKSDKSPESQLIIIY